VATPSVALVPVPARYVHGVLSCWNDVIRFYKYVAIINYCCHRLSFWQVKPFTKDEVRKSYKIKEVILLSQSRYLNDSLICMRWLQNALLASRRDACPFVLICLFLFPSFNISCSIHHFSNQHEFPVIEIEEEVYTCTPANNGAGPQWDFGSTNLVRTGDRVFASGLETLVAKQPLNNTQCTLWQRDSRGWAMVVRDPSGLTREPCPITILPMQDTVLLSSNPTLNKFDQRGGGPAIPMLLEFSVISPLSAVKITPVWQEKNIPQFTEHSYRSFAADGTMGELILFQNIGYAHAEWAYRDADSNWAVQGQLRWPWSTEYEKPEPVRICYPNVFLYNRSVHFVGVSDITEPNKQWLDYKKKLTEQDTHYVFRRLFYTWVPDIRKDDFVNWIEIASRDKYGGRITPGDLWVAPDGSAHIVWDETAIDTRLRDMFFPGEKQRFELNYAVIQKGNVVLQRTLLATDEGKPGPIPHLPRFQITPEGRMFVFFYVNGTDENGKTLSENRLMELHQDGSISPITVVPLSQPLSSYFNASVRGGSMPSRTLDLLGTSPGSPNIIRYACITLY
jgi:hypothetical protein